MNVDQIIDKKTVAIPGPIGQVTPSMQQLHDEAKTYAANTQQLQDQAVTGLISNTGTSTRQKLNQLLGGSMVWFGDSWSDPRQTGNSQNGAIPKAVAAALGCTLHNYAVGGAGLTTGTTFKAQIANAAADQELNANDVRYAIIFGGVNDRNTAVSASVINDTLNALVASFPNARKIFIPMQHAWNANDWGNTDVWLRSINRNGVPSVAIVNGAAFWAINDTESFNNNNPGHPTSAGTNVFATKIVSALLGGSVTANIYSFNLTLADGISGNLQLLNSRTPGYFRAIGYIQSNKDGDLTVGVLANRVLAGTTFIAPDTSVNVSNWGAPMFINFTTKSTDPAIADYIGPQTTLISHNMKAGVQYYFNREYPYF
jgi:hypothetical protein